MGTHEGPNGHKSKPKTARYGTCRGFFMSEPDDERAAVRRWHELIDQLPVIAAYTDEPGRGDAA